MKKNNIILIGMPASGKSTLGKALAKHLNWKFIDSDKLIEQSQGKKLKDIISEVGNEGFLEIENDVNRSIEGENLVIAPGGSVIFCKDAMEHFKSIGIVVYIKISHKILIERIGDPIKRGVVLKDGQTIKDVFNDRKPYFEKYADVVYPMYNTGIRKSVERFLDIVKKDVY